MIKRFQELLNGDTTDPINQFVTNCISTYGISLILGIGFFLPNGADIRTLMRAIQDCIVPSAVTLTFSVVFQNNATAAGTWAATHNGYTNLCILCVVFYILCYLLARNYAIPYSTLITIAATFLLYWITLKSIEQILKGTAKGSVTTPKQGARP